MSELVQWAATADPARMWVLLVGAPLALAVLVWALGRAVSWNWGAIAGVGAFLGLAFLIVWTDPSAFSDALVDRALLGGKAVPGAARVVSVNSFTGVYWVSELPMGVVRLTPRVKGLPTIDVQPRSVAGVGLPQAEWQRVPILLSVRLFKPVLGGVAIGVPREQVVLAEPFGPQPKQDREETRVEVVYVRPTLRSKLTLFLLGMLSGFILACGLGYWLWHRQWVRGWLRGRLCPPQQEVAAAAATDTT